MVTGNGHGSPSSPRTRRRAEFLPHPHGFTRPAGHPLEKVSRSHLKALSWGAPERTASADYVDDSHVIRLRRADGSGTIFMPFGFERPALIIGKTSATVWRVEWNRRLLSRKTVGAGAQLLRFDGIEEPLLLIPLAVVRKARPNQPLAASAAWALIALENDQGADAAIRDFNRWRSGLSPAALVRRELAQVERWRTKPSLSSE